MWKSREESFEIYFSFSSLPIVSLCQVRHHFLNVCRTQFSFIYLYISNKLYHLNIKLGQFRPVENILQVHQNRKKNYV